MFLTTESAIALPVKKDNIKIPDLSKMGMM